MHRPSSSTSSSESNAAPAQRAGEAKIPPRRPLLTGDLREALVVAAWAALFLAAGDAAVNRLFALPRDPRARPQSQLHAYFNYGWSTEAKIRRALGHTDQTGAPLMLAGWVDREVARGRTEPKLSPGDLPISCYGMSFSQIVATEMAVLDPSVRLRLFGGPAAPVSHSYAIYAIDRGGSSQVVILAVLGSSVQALATNNCMTWRFEGPAPFTYPRYFVRGAGMQAEWPSVSTLDDLRARLADPSQWESYLAELRAHDEFYNGFLFRHDISDNSALVRMVRRALAQRWQSSRLAQIHGPSGFTGTHPMIDSLRQIIAAFAASARRDGKFPLVLLIQDQGFRDHVYRILEPVLSRDQIPYVSTHTICPETDARNFVSDGHFTQEANRKIARVVLETIRREPSVRRGPRPLHSEARPVD